MRIKINNEEFYEFRLKDEMSIQELSEVLFKLNSLSKIFSKDVFISNELDINDKIKHTKYTKKIKVAPVMIRRRQKHKKGSINYLLDRNKAVEVLKLHYHGTKEQKHAFAKKYNNDWNEMSKAFSNLRKKFNIPAEEIGLRYFPRKNEKHDIKNREKQEWKKDFVFDPTITEQMQPKDTDTHKNIEDINENIEFTPVQQNENQNIE